jgi:serine/threonine-protein kinase RsbW
MPEWEFASDLAHLSAVRSWIRTTCQEVWGSAGQEALDQLLLAVQEAGTNIVRHGYQDPAQRPIHLRVEADAGQVSVVFTYPGQPFNPNLVPEPLFDGTREGGYGVYLIAQLVDEVHYSHDSTGLCRVHLHQHCPPHRPLHRPSPGHENS